MKEASEVRVLLEDVYHQGNEIGAGILEVLSLLDQGRSRIESKLDRVLDSHPPGPSSTINLLTRSAEPSIGSTEKGIQVSVVHAGHSMPWLKCHCRRRSISAQLRTCLGNLFIGYSAVVVRRGHRRQCFCRPRGELTLEYYFPASIVKRVLLLKFGYDGFTNVNVSFSVAQVLPPDHVIWLMLYEDNIKGMQKIFSNGGVSLGAQGTTGLSLLQVSQENRFST